MILLYILLCIISIQLSISIDTNNSTILPSQSLSLIKKVIPNKNDLLKRFNNSNNNKNQKKAKYLLWFSNNDGIFSQFLQMKIMHHVAQNIHKRTLLIAPIKSVHMPNKTIILCDLFQLPITIQCLNNDEMYNWNHNYNDNKCLNDLKVNIMLRASTYSKSIEKMEVVCYKGLVTFLGAATRRNAVLNAVDFASPNLILSKIYKENFLMYKKNLDLNNNYTVIHWRRGDQLSTRCKQGRDLSGINIEMLTSNYLKY